MYRPEIKRKKSGAPVLSRKEIDTIGENIIGDFMPEALKYPQEIDIDLLAQEYLRMEQDFQYLSHCGVYLGMTVFNDTDKVPVYDPINNCADYISAKAHTVIIDRTLLEENQEHRYRFTMGHEVGHEFLHKEYFAYDPAQITLFDYFGNAPIPMVQCRVDTKKLDAKTSTTWGDREWMEWQANAISSALLMPVSMVRKVAEDFNKPQFSNVLCYYALAEKVASVFNVSLEAAGYRLKQLGYIPPEINLSAGVSNMISFDLACNY